MKAFNARRGGFLTDASEDEVSTILDERTRARNVENQTDICGPEEKQNIVS